MNKLAIQVDKLSKKYRIGAAAPGYKTLRESLSLGASAPLRAIRSRFSSNGHRSVEPNEVWALRNVSFQINQGDVVGVIGRNGAGKTTLLRILSRITEPTSGSADIYGRVGSMLEVGTGFHPELTGRENIFLSGAILGMTRSAILKQFDEIIAFAAVERFVDTPIKHYSSGMYLRLAFAVAAHLDPDILLVDEVLAVGDVAFQRKCLGRMDKIANQGRTVIFVSHNMGMIRSLCTRGILLNDGQVAQCGDVATCITDYLNAVNDQESLQDDTASHRQDGFGALTLTGSHGNSIHQGQPFNVATRFTLREDASGFDLYCMLTDIHGRVIFRLRQSSSELGIHGSVQGEHALRIQFPPLWLVPGVYSLQLKAKCWGRMPSKFVADPMALDVSGTANSTCSQDPGFLHPQTKWSVEFSPANRETDSVSCEA